MDISKYFDGIITKVFKADYKKHAKALIVLFVLILILPIVLTKLPFTLFDLSQTGQIGDTIGGITAPFIGIIAGYLTFLAFHEQSKANIESAKDLKVERFENRFFNFINLLHDQERDTLIPTIGSSKQAYHFMFYEYKAIFYQIVKFGAYDNMPDRRKLELDQAFHLFLNGVSKSSISRLSEDSKGIDLEEIKHMNEYLLTQQDYYISSGKMPKYLRDYANNGIRLFDGHRLYLVSFYRSFCMTLQYLYQALDQKAIEKEILYRNILLAQLSEHEIALLRIIYLYGKDQNLMFIEDCYKDRVDTFFKKTLLEYIVSKTMNSEAEGFIDN